MIKSGRRFMSIAVQEALLGMSKGDGGPFGAVIVRDNHIVSQGHNMVRVTQDPTAHAEIYVIREATKKLGRFDLSDCELYSTCEPCPMCLGAIYYSKIGKLFYGCTSDDAAGIGFEDRYIYDVIRGKIKDNKLDVRSIERDMCLETFHSWEDKTRPVQLPL